MGCGFGEGGPRGKAPFSSHHMKGACHLHDFVIVGMDLDHLAEGCLSGLSTAVVPSSALAASPYQDLIRYGQKHSHLYQTNCSEAGVTGGVCVRGRGARGAEQLEGDKSGCPSVFKQVPTSKSDIRTPLLLPRPPDRNHKNQDVR